MKAILLAGGSGTRLWPLSRRNFPKQFLELFGDKSLLHQSAERLLTVLSSEDLIVMTNGEYEYYVKSNLDESSHVVLEPESKNTAPAIALAMKYCLEKLGCSEEEVLFVSPSDHIIRPVDKFAQYITLAETIAKEGKIVTFGITPTRPETGYGYIRVKNQRPRSGDTPCFPVEEFMEKPDLETATKYVSDGNYYWNSGMFAFRIRSMMDELNRHAPSIGNMLEKSFDEIVSGFGDMPDISIDYAVMERSKNVVTVPVDVHWNDIGSWDSLFDVLDKDASGNAIKGDVIALDTQDTMVIGNKRLIATIGLEDCLIVETDDAILISKRKETQKVKEIVGRLKESNRKEELEHSTIHRPWGSYTVLEEGPTYKIKRIVVKPGEKLSLQMHHHRSEHWVVASGTAKVTIRQEEFFIHKNESTYVPNSTLHRLENPGKISLEIIEVQNGDYLNEDDIIRVEDHYGRR